MPPKGYDVGGRYREDPVGSHKPRGKARSQRKSGRDKGLTPTELHRKNILMNQFRRTGEGPGGNSDAYRNSEAWCACGRHFKVAGGPCYACAKKQFDNQGASHG